MLPSPTTAGASTVRRKRPRSSRSRGLRTTTGCQTCRSRHMKCDEAKPVCGPCAKGERDCTYKSAPQRVRFFVTRPTLENSFYHSRPRIIGPCIKDIHAMSSWYQIGAFILGQFQEASVVYRTPHSRRTRPIQRLSKQYVSVVRFHFVASNAVP